MLFGQTMSMQLVGGQLSLRLTVTVKVHWLLWPLPAA
jgi:hypothetical protein